MTNSADQIKIFRSVFQGREDAYGLETDGGPIAVREKLSDEIILDHLNGKKRIGVYPLLHGGLINLAVIDLDEREQEKVNRICTPCLENHLFPSVEKSKSKGFHIWFFFNKPVSAKAVRKSLLKILKDIGVDCEVFPKQNSLTSDNGLGNFVFLPLFGQTTKSLRRTGTLFLDENFVPFPDQFSYLSKVQKTKSEVVVRMAEGIQEEPTTEKQVSDSKADSGLDIEKYLTHYGISYKTKKDGRRTLYLLSQCLFSEDHTAKDNVGDSSIVQDDSGKITYQCFHAHCKERTWADARQIISGDEVLSKFLKGKQADKRKTELKLTTIKEILEYPDLNFLIEDLFPEETIVVIGGYTGTGKSMIVLEIVKSVVTGSPLFGRYSAKRGPVLIIDEETPRPLLRDRIQKMKFDPSWPVYFLHFQDIKIDNESVFNSLVDKINEINPVLVVFDSLIRIHRKREKEAEEMAQVIDALRKIANMGITVIPIHHHKKGGGPLSEKLRGSSDIPGGIDIEFALTPEKEGSDILLFQSVKTRIKPFPPIRLKLKVDEDSSSIEYCGTKSETILDIVTAILSEENEFLTVKDIVQRLTDKKFDDFKEHEIRKALKEGVRLKMLKSEEIRVGKTKANSYGINHD